MNKYILYALIIIVLLVCSKREEFVEVFGFAGYSKPTTLSYDNTEVPIASGDFVEQSKFEISPDIVNTIVNTIQTYIREKQDLCVQPLETSFVKKFVDKSDENRVLYKTRMMFMVEKGFPYGVAISADVLMTPAPVLARIQTQPSEVDDSITPYSQDVASDFVEWNEVMKTNVPLLSELKTDENLLGKVVNGSDKENPGK